MAAELMLILSAPASKMAPASVKVRKPPPTVNGMKSCWAVFSHRFQQRGSFLVCRCNVEQYDFVRACGAVGGSKFRRIARIAQVHELRALHDASGVHVKTSDDAFGQHLRPDLFTSFAVKSFFSAYSAAFAATSASKPFVHELGAILC
jgi:hypothetical protein